jgi:outer membrane protein assembly factor BamE (lipoprotein component of BamABCDE complex)
VQRQRLGKQEGSGGEVRPLWAGRVRILTAWVLLTLAACGPLAPTPQVRGNPVDPDRLAELVPGVSMRSDAESLLGSPTTKASFDDNTWIYIGQITHLQVAGKQSIDKQEVVVLTFDDKGILRSIKVLDKKDALPVAMVDRITPSPGGNISAWDQIVRGIGMINPLGGMLGGMGPMGGAMVPGGGGMGMGGGMP